MYNSSKTISVQEVNNHDWFFYKLYGESLNNGSIFLNSKQYFHLWNLYRLSNADDASFTFRVMLFQFRATCARVQPVYLWIQARAARCISQMLPDKKKSIICQQVQHNFEQYITRLKNKTRSTRKKQLFFLKMCKVDGNLSLYMLIQIKVKVWVCTREVIYSLRNSSGLWLIKYFKIERSNPACNNCMSPARQITPHRLTIKPRRPGFRRRWQILCPIFSEIWIFQNLNALWRHKMLRGV